MAYEHRAATISQTALTDSPLARARMPQATAPRRATAVQMAIRRGVQRPVSGVAVAVMWSSQMAAVGPPCTAPGRPPKGCPNLFPVRRPDNPSGGTRLLALWTATTLACSLSATLRAAQVHVWLSIRGRACPLPSAPGRTDVDRYLRVDGGRDKHP